METLGFDVFFEEVGVIIAGIAQENASGVEIFTHVFNLAHEFAGFLAGFFYEIGRSAEDERAEILGAGFVVLPI